MNSWCYQTRMTSVVHPLSVCINPVYARSITNFTLLSYYLQFVEHAGARSEAEQSISSSHSRHATVQHYCQVMTVSMQAIETRLATEIETRLQRCKRRDGYTRSGSPHRFVASWFFSGVGDGGAGGLVPPHFSERRGRAPSL